jgi:hypothetical protein
LQHTSGLPILVLDLKLRSPENRLESFETLLHQQTSKMQHFSNPVIPKSRIPNTTSCEYPFGFGLLSRSYVAIAPILTYAQPGPTLCIQPLSEAALRTAHRHENAIAMPHDRPTQGSLLIIHTRMPSPSVEAPYP